MEIEMELSDGETPVTCAPTTSVPAYSSATDLASRGNLISTLEEGQEATEHAQVPGYIFMCNGKTKPECFKYRVFGLPKGKQVIAENIKPGMKLFLYDFERKLLYGIYEATTGGMLNIEPNAFDGKYPAQVGFRIYKDCYPLSDSDLKPAIRDNYRGVKFKQELSCQQVMNLLSAFRSFTPPQLEPAHPDVGFVDSPSTRTYADIGTNQFDPPTRALSFEERYIAEKQRQLRHASSFLGTQFIRGGESLNIRGHSIRAADNPPTNNFHSPLSHTTHTFSGRYPPHYLSENHQPHLLGGRVESSMADPRLKYMSVLSKIRRYGTLQEPVSHLVTSRDRMMPSRNESYSMSTGTVYNPSAAAGIEHYPASGNEHYNSTGAENEQHSSTYKRESDSTQQPEIPAAYQHHLQPSITPKTIQSYSEATGDTQQSHAEAITYAHQSHAAAITYDPHTHAGAVAYNYPRTHAGAVAYNYPHPHAGAVAYDPQTHAGAVQYDPQAHSGAAAYDPQTHAGAVTYDPQIHAGAVAYDPQAHAGAVAYDPQANGGAVAYDPQATAETVAYDPRSHSGAVAYDPQSHSGTVAYDPQSYAGGGTYYSHGVNSYDPQLQVGVNAYAPPSHAGSNTYCEYAQQSHAVAYGYAAPSHASQVGYPSQSHTEAVGYTQPSVQSHNSVLATSATAEGNASNPYDYSNATTTTTSYK